MTERDDENDALTKPSFCGFDNIVECFYWIVR